MAQYSPLTTEDAQQLYRNSKNIFTKFEKNHGKKNQLLFKKDFSSVHLFLEMKVQQFIM